MVKYIRARNGIIHEVVDMKSEKSSIVGTMYKTKCDSEIHKGTILDPKSYNDYDFLCPHATKMCKTICKW